MKFDWKTEIIGGRKVTFYRYATQDGPSAGIEYKASRNFGGSFNVATHDGEFKNVPFWGNFHNYAEMDKFAEETDWKLTPTFVCHVAHNEEDAYVFWTKGKSYYIRIEE